MFAHLKLLIYRYSLRPWRNGRRAALRSLFFNRSESSSLFIRTNPARWFEPTVRQTASRLHVFLLKTVALTCDYDLGLRLKLCSRLAARAKVDHARFLHVRCTLLLCADRKHHGHMLGYGLTCRSRHQAMTR